MINKNEFELWESKSLGKLAHIEFKIQKKVYLKGFFFCGLNVFFVFYSFRPNNLNV